MLHSGDVVAERYRLAAFIGSGGMGTVWKAVEQPGGRTVALKRPHSGCGETQRAQLEAEARVAKQVTHPNAVTVYEVTDGDCWLVMEYVPSRSLAEILAEDGPLPSGTVARIGVQIAAVLAAAHAAGVVHRDVSPSNVLVREDGIVKVTDFGISLWREATLTVSGKISGKPGYLAPEVAGGGRATPESDMFSLGATLFSALEGSPPFGTGDPAAVLVRARDGAVPGCDRAGPLGTVVGSLMAREPADRPSAQRAVELLTEVGGSGLPVLPAVARPRRRRRTVVGALGAAGAAAALTTAVLVWAPWSSDDGSEALPAPTAGDERTADPCALLDPAVFERFGSATFDRYRGSLVSCDVVVDVGAEDEVEVHVRFSDPSSGEARPPTERTVVQVSRAAESATECEVTLTLADRNQVVVRARLPEGPNVDLCAVVDVAVDQAIRSMGDGPLPRRSDAFAPGSLGTLNACSMLDQTALSVIPGVDAARADPGFGSWSCHWYSDTADLEARITFERQHPFDATDGRPMRIGGRAAVVRLGSFDDDSCAVAVAHRTFPVGPDRTVEEHLFVVVYGSGSLDALCDKAVALAGPATAALPGI